MMRKFWYAKVVLYDKHRKYKNYYFQQDGATPHRANVVQTWLTGKFGD
jgi:hypothetical protein